MNKMKTLGQWYVFWFYTRHANRCVWGGWYLPTVGNFHYVDLPRLLWSIAQSVATQSADGPYVRAGTHIYGWIDGIWCIWTGNGWRYRVHGIIWILIGFDWLLKNVDCGLSSSDVGLFQVLKGWILDDLGYSYCFVLLESWKSSGRMDGTHESVIICIVLLDFMLGVRSYPEGHVYSSCIYKQFICIE